MNDLDFFTQFLYEAPGDDPPPDAGDNMSTEVEDPSPPDMASEDMGFDSPPDIGGDDMGMDDMGGGFDDSPPDMGEEGFGSEEGDGQTAEDPNEAMQLDDKVSAIMNQRLYQKYLSLINRISNEISQIKNNNDILYSISPDSLDIIESLNKLDENIHLYLKNNFMNEDYSKNLLFFNKCINLWPLLNKVFDKKIKSGIRNSE